MDPLNWATRYYLIECIEHFGFDGGWEPIIRGMQQLYRVLLKKDYDRSIEDTHLMYLQMLAEYGIYRSFEDALEKPPPDVIQNIKDLRKSQVYHELLIINNDLRLDSYICWGQKHEFPEKPLRWTRFEESHIPQTQKFNLIGVMNSVKTQKWASVVEEIPQDCGVPIIESIFSRCLNGTVKTPLELMRDVLLKTLSILIGTFSEREKRAAMSMRLFVFEQLKSELENDPEWLRVRDFVMEGIQS